MFQGLTNKGKEYMAKCLVENKPVSFTKAKIGDGTIALEENPEDFIDIKSLKKEVNIVEKVQNNDAVKLTIQFENTGILDGYFLREIGIYVEDEGQEILYWYINDGSESSWLPPAAKSPVNFKFFINLMATNLETIIVNWTGKDLWIDREYFGKELDKKLNAGPVSIDYNTAKKMEDKIKFLATQIEKTPIGTILPFASGTIPKDYLLCDGREITKNNYPELYDILPFGGHIDERVFRSLAKNEVPNMTGPTLNGYTVTESSVFSESFRGWKAFDSIFFEDNGGWASLNGQKEGWVQIQYPNKRALSSFAIRTRKSSPGSKLEKISVYGITVTSEDELFSEDLTKPFDEHEKKEFKVNFNKKTYDKFKIKVSAPNDQYCAIDEIELFTVDMSQFPNINQETTKKYLPDLRGQFLRGIKDGRKLLAWENEDIKKHNHKAPLAYPPELSEGGTLKEYTDIRHGSVIYQTLQLDSNINDNVYGRPIAKETYEGSETRPSNIGVNYIIKAKNGINDNSLPAYIESLLNDLNNLKMDITDIFKELSTLTNTTLRCGIDRTDVTENGFWSQNNGSFVSHNNFNACNKYLKIKPNTTYYGILLSSDNINYSGINNLVVCWYDRDKNFISGQYNTTVEYISPLNAYYMRVSYLKHDYSFHSITEYNPNSTNKTNPELKIFGYDTYSIKDSVEKNVTDIKEVRNSVEKNTADIKELKSSFSDILENKSLGLDGDSICYGAGFNGGYGKIIENKCKMKVQNIAVSGATISTGDKSRHRICDSLSSLSKDNDYIICEGGINDYNQNVPIGEIILRTYTHGHDDDSDLDTTTFCGGLEKVARTLIRDFAGKKVGFITTHRALNLPMIKNKQGKTLTDYNDLIIKVMNKYGVPVLDLYNSSPLITALPSLQHYTKDNDGVHPTEDGYNKYYVDKIISWLKTL